MTGRGRGRRRGGEPTTQSPQTSSEPDLIGAITGLIRQQNELLNVFTQRSSGDNVNNNLIPRVEYKLTSNIRYDVWFDNFSSELSALDLLDIIQPDIPPSRVYTQNEMIKRKAKVRHILINRIDESYHNRIVSIKDPYEALVNIREFRKAEINTTSATLLKQLEDLRLKKGEESVAQFIMRFEAAITKYEMLSEPLKHPYVCTRFVIAVRERFELFELTAETRNIQENYDALTKLCLWFEANERERVTCQTNQTTVKTVGEGTVMVMNNKNKNNYRKRFSSRGVGSKGFKKRFRKGQYCYTCGANGHKAQDCLVAEGSGIKFCYKCRKLATHLASNCDTNKTKDNSNVGYKKSYTPKTGTWKGNKKEGGESKGSKSN